MAEIGQQRPPVLPHVQDKGEDQHHAQPLMHAMEGCLAHMEKQGDAGHERDKKKARDKGRGITVKNRGHDDPQEGVAPIRRIRGRNPVAAPQHFLSPPWRAGWIDGAKRQRDGAGGCHEAQTDRVAPTHPQPLPPGRGEGLHFSPRPRRAGWIARARSASETGRAPTSQAMSRGGCPKTQPPIANPAPLGNAGASG